MVEKIKCDICGEAITDYENDLFHHTGILKGKLNTHIHLCAACNNPALMQIDFDALLQQGLLKPNLLLSSHYSMILHNIKRQIRQV